MLGRAAVVLRTTTRRSGAEHRSRSRAFSRRAPGSSVAGMPLWIHTSGCAIDSHQLIAAAILRRRGDSFKKLMLAGLVAVLGFAPAFALAQAQVQEKMLVGQVQSVDQTGTEITLTDGTKLLTPPGAI